MNRKSQSIPTLAGFAIQVLIFIIGVSLFIFIIVKSLQTPGQEIDAVLYDLVESINVGVSDAALISDLNFKQYSALMQVYVEENNYAYDFLKDLYEREDSEIHTQEDYAELCNGMYCICAFEFTPDSISMDYVNNNLALAITNLYSGLGISFDSGEYENVYLGQLFGSGGSFDYMAAQQATTYFFNSFFEYFDDIIETKDNYINFYCYPINCEDPFGRACYWSFDQSDEINSTFVFAIPKGENNLYISHGLISRIDIYTPCIDSIVHFEASQ